MVGIQADGGGAVASAAARAVRHDDNKPGWFEQNRQELAKEMAARPGLLPEVALGETAEQLADGIELAPRKLYAEAVEQKQREQDSRNAADLAQMKSALDRTHSIRVLKRELHGGR